MATGTIVLTRGDDYAETHAFDTAAGDDYDLTDCAVWFTVKARTFDADDDALIQHVSGDGSLTITDAATGAVSHTISAAETALLAPGVYRYDYQLVAADDTVATLERGKLVVRADVTRSIA
jgi:hypothetical protein